ncbi:MAG TPA: methyltransferase domain-containing protein [Rhabdochlamydiaceae bacterium]|nr:methyltransferase domain-containing protein [Rhabdochlamydiaceae bacterium]
MNKLSAILLSFSFLTCSSLPASNISSFTFKDVDRGWNSDSLARMYFHHSETQRQWAWESLSKISFSGNEKILDFGCGDGKVSAEMARLARNGSVLGVDVSEKMIHLANIYFPSYAFPNLTFKNSQSVTFDDMPGNQDCDLVCAFTVFHLISNQLEVLKNLKTHLKSSGKLLLIIPTGKNQALYQAATETFQKYNLETPWKNKIQENARSMRTLDGCTSFLNEAGYQVESIEIIDTDNPFYDMDDFITWMMGTASATWQIPASLSQIFFTDLVHRMYELDPSIIDEEGRFRFKMSRLHATAIPTPQID